MDLRSQSIGPASKMSGELDAALHVAKGNDLSEHASSRVNPDHAIVRFNNRYVNGVLVAVFWIG